MTTGVKKKRELAHLLKESIIFLTSLSEEVHSLEYTNHHRHSRDLKKKLVDFHHDGPTVKLLEAVKSIRHEINAPYYTYKKKETGRVNNFKK